MNDQARKPVILKHLKVSWKNQNYHKKKIESIQIYSTKIENQFNSKILTTFLNLSRFLLGEEDIKNEDGVEDEDGEEAEEVEEVEGKQFYYIFFLSNKTMFYAALFVARIGTIFFSNALKKIIYPRFLYFNSLLEIFTLHQVKKKVISNK